LYPNREIRCAQSCWSLCSSPPPEQRRNEVRILDVFRNAAIVRVDAGQWVDYLQEARWNGEWKIVNVLWELRR
jgi:hypothetical protein